MTSFFLARYCNLAKRFSDLRRCLGLDVTSPLDVTANAFSPRSTPILVASGGNSWMSVSTNTEAFPVGVLDIVQDLMTPENGRCNLMRMVLFSFGIRRNPS